MPTQAGYTGGPNIETRRDYQGQGLRRRSTVSRLGTSPNEGRKKGKIPEKGIRDVVQPLRASGPLRETHMSTCYCNRHAFYHQLSFMGRGGIGNGEPLTRH